jgi:chromate transporter
LILLVTILLKTALKNKYVQAVLRGLKPCVIGIVLATGLFMIFTNCFGSPVAPVLNLTASLITLLLVAISIGYRFLRHKKLSPLLLIAVSALCGVVIYGI